MTQQNKRVEKGLVIVSLFGILSATILGSTLFNTQKDQQASAQGSGTWIIQVANGTDFTPCTADDLKKGTSCRKYSRSANSSDITVDLPTDGGKTIYPGDQIKLSWNYLVNKETTGCWAVGESPTWTAFNVTGARVQDPQPTHPINATRPPIDKSGSVIFREAPGVYTYSIYCTTLITAAYPGSDDTWYAGTFRVTVTATTPNPGTPVPPASYPIR